MKRRNCVEVISDMILEIPDSETQLLEDLNWNLDDASYKAPEETIQWNRTMSTLMKHIPEPKEDWQFKVLEIFTMKTREELEHYLEIRKKK